MIINNVTSLAQSIMSLTETLCNSIAFTVITKYGKGAARQISTMFGRVYHVAFQKIPRNGTF